MLRWLACVPLMVVLAAPLPAGEKKQGPAVPTVVVRVRSLDTLVDHFKLVAGMVGKENIAQQVQGIIRSKIGAKGLEGIDPTRPFGFYGRIGNDLNDVAGVALIPVKDEKTVLDLLENLNLKVTKNRDVYTVTTGTPVDAHFRFHKGYAYVTALNLGALSAGQILDPDQVFPAGQTAALSATVRIDQIPDVAKKLVISGAEDKLEQFSGKQGNETELQHSLRIESQKEFLRTLKTVLNDGQELTAAIDLNAKTKELNAAFALTGKPGSELATAIAEIGKAQSVFGGLKADKAVLDGRLHFTIPPAMGKALEQGLKNEFAKGIDQITDDGKRKQAEMLAQAILAGFRGGDIDALVQLNAKDKHYNLIAGIKLQDGDKLGKLVHDLASELLNDVPQAERDKIKLNAESVGDIKIHRIDVQQMFDAKARGVFGDNPLYVAFRKDAALVAVGEGGLEALKTALAAPTGASPVLRVDIAVAQLAPLLTDNDAQGAAMTKMFADAGHVRLSVQGGQALRGEFVAHLSVLRFFNLLKKGPALSGD